MERKIKPFLYNQLNEIESLVSSRDKLNANVSSSDVAWHLDHILKVIIGVYNTLSQSDPDKYKPDFSASRTLVFTTGYIPRGRAKSPKSVLPPDEIVTEDIFKQLSLSREKLVSINLLEENKYFKHFSFGMLNRDKAKRFLEIHTNHHLKIIRGIVSSI